MTPEKAEAPDFSGASQGQWAGSDPSIIAAVNVFGAALLVMGLCNIYLAVAR